MWGEEMKRYIELRKPVAITAHSCVGGKKEKDGPLAQGFDLLSGDDYFGRKTWEKAETAMQKLAIRTLLDKRNLKISDVDIALGGDLCNQITSTGFAYRDIPIPFLGMYGACSTMALTMATAACLISGGIVDNAIAGASSHFCTAERQFRTPLDYGGKRTPTAQWTVTGAANVFLEREGKGPFISRVCFGKIVDLGITDANNMGAAMAPAAAATLVDYFIHSGKKPAEYDAIYTGDLGSIGTELLKQLMAREGFELVNHIDCGLVIYNNKRQNVPAGASGCGCSGSVLAADILPKFEKKELKKILFMATGALLSTTTTMQKESIPSVAHLVEIVASKEDI